MGIYPPLLVSFLIGAALFGIFYFINLKFNKMKLSFPLYLLSGVGTFWVIMLFTFDPNNVYARIGYMIMLILTAAVMTGYGLTWFITHLIKNKA